MKEFYLGLRGLDAADLKLVGVFLKFTSDGARRWQLADGRPADLVLSALPPTADDALPAVQNEHAWILPPGRRTPGGRVRLLQRPLQIEAFRALLAARESELGAPAAAPAVSATAAGAAVTAAPRSSDGSGGVMAGGVAPFVNDPRYTYRIRKWPGSEMLRGKPKFVRMLGFLSHKPLSVERLMVLSGIDESSCLELLGALDMRRLLSRHEATPDSRPPAFAPEASAAPVRTSAVEAPAAGGLFKRLRARLGLV